jgi:type II secretory ATPase GspE/PulE/Tfp pilus assembly ATPase PilB-like protein
VHELIVSTKAVRSIISGGKHEKMVDAILEKALQEGTRTLGQDAIEKVLQKTTSFEEAIRVTELG